MTVGGANVWRLHWGIPARSTEKIVFGAMPFLGGIGLVLPGVLKILTWLTPLAAALLALMMLGAIKFHVTCCEKPKIAVDLVLFALAAGVAYGRWMIAPF